MRAALVFVVGFAALAFGSVEAEAQGQTASVSATTGSLAGKWTYRSFRNDPVPVGDDANKALALIFAEAAFSFELPTSTTLKETIDWDGGGLDLQGTIRPTAESGGPVVEIVGTGRPGTSTAGWEYDYHAQLAYQWPKGVNQVPALVGTVMRAKAHVGGAAGYVASFIAVKQP
jgi:hypothetical protein